MTRIPLWLVLSWPVVVGVVSFLIGYAMATGELPWTGKIRAWRRRLSQRGVTLRK